MGIPLSKSLSDLDYVCQKLKGKKVILASPFVWNKIAQMPADDAVVFRNRIYENAIKYGFSFVNASKFVYDRQDEIHPSELGCRNINDQMIKTPPVKIKHRLCKKNSPAKKNGSFPLLGSTSKPRNPPATF